jgi:translation initiation factor 2 subunit 2
MNQDLFHSLLDNLYSNLDNKTEQSLVLEKLILCSESKRTLWKNIYVISKNINRNIDDFIKYISDELRVSYCWQDHTDKRKGVLFAAKIHNKDLCFIIKKYISEYVKCKSCNNTNTILSKKDKDRFSMLECQHCKSINYI